MRVLAFLLLLCAGAANAAEEAPLSGLIAAPLTVPVTIGGEQLTLEGYVVRPDQPGRFPLVIVVHGTPSVDGPEFFHALVNRSPIAYNKALVAFAQRGYAAVAVMRRGFGRSGGTYVEALPTPCDYVPAVRVSAEDVTAVVASLRAEPWVDAEHVVLMGHSTGGLAVTAAAAMQPAGVVGVLNFDGGRHGRGASGDSCEDSRLVDVMATLGPEVHVPALWLYAENDRSYRPDLARRMFDAYVVGGAQAEFAQLPPFGTDGHDLVIEAPANLWLPAVETFLGRLGLPTAAKITLAPLSELAAPSNLAPVCRQVFARYSTFRWEAKAFAITSKGSCGSAAGRTVDEARARAMTDCQAHAHGDNCSIYAVGQHLAAD